MGTGRISESKLVKQLEDGPQLGRRLEVAIGIQGVEGRSQNGWKEEVPNSFSSDFDDVPKAENRNQTARQFRTQLSLAQQRLNAKAQRSETKKTKNKKKKIKKTTKKRQRNTKQKKAKPDRPLRRACKCFRRRPTVGRCQAWRPAKCFEATTSLETTRRWKQCCAARTRSCGSRQAFQLS